ncbi:MAG TPA: hypothetical protein VN782_04620 [Usitatibacter sp.]|nr:hypothetical protein [Usitatibacter sp.]
MTRIRSASAVLAVLIAGATLSTAALAETQWEKDHPRRDQVNDRLQHQDRRIHQEVKEGELTKGQAAKLHRQDHAIRKEERRMAARHGGHLTKPEQAKINRQENRVSREIGK